MPFFCARYFQKSCEYILMRFLVKKNQPSYLQGFRIVDEDNDSIDPCVFHFAGSKMHTKTSIKQLVQKRRIWETQDISKDVTVVTYSNFKNEAALELQLRVLGIDHVVLGRSLERFQPRDKAALIVDYLPNITTPYLLSLDASDVLLQKSVGEILNRFKTFDCDALFNAEVFHYPAVTPTKDFEKKVSTKKKYRFLNSGAYIAKTDFCREHFGLMIGELYHELWEHGHKVGRMTNSSDQILFKMLYKRFYPQIMIDSDRKIFQVLNKKVQIVWSAK